MQSREKNVKIKDFSLEFDKSTYYGRIASAIMFEDLSELNQLGLAGSSWLGPVIDLSWPANTTDGAQTKVFVPQVSFLQFAVILGCGKALKIILKHMGNTW